MATTIDNDDDLYNLPLSERPPLRYVLTVPPDLYRKVVAEMSDNLLHPWYGCSKCLSSDSGKADIRIALAILCVVFVLLLINTEAFGPHS
jgi:hypothetical protein